MARVICQACGGRTEEGGFCEKCGNPLEAAAGQDLLVDGEGAADPADKASTLTATPVAGTWRFDEAAGPVRIISLPFAGQAACPAPDAASAGEGVPDDFDDCAALRVERDMVAFCVAGTNGLLRLRLTALDAGVRDLSVQLSLPCAAGSAIHPVRWYHPKRNKSGEFSMTVPPLEEGAYAAELNLKFALGGVAESYAANIELYVYPSGSSAKQIADSIVFNINNDIKTGHASDVRQSFDAASVLGRFTHNGNSRGLPELLDLLKTDTRAFRRICFNETGERGLWHPPTEALSDRLTLEFGDRVLHLVAGPRVTLGRHRDNRIVTRLFESGAPVMSQSSLLLSKHHCTLELDGDECVIHDGAAAAGGNPVRSGGGVFWQGCAVAGSVRVPADKFPRKAVLGLAGSAAEPCFGFSVTPHRFDRGRCARCDDRDAALCRRGCVPALELRRTDHVQETFVVLWACMDLGLVFSELHGLTVCHERGAFSWRSGNSSDWLKPGRFAVAGTEAVVRQFQQYGL